MVLPFFLFIRTEIKLSSPDAIIIEFFQYPRQFPDTIIQLTARGQNSFLNPDFSLTRKGAQNIPTGFAPLKNVFYSRK